MLYLEINTRTNSPFSKDTLEEFSIEPLTNRVFITKLYDTYEYGFNKHTGDLEKVLDTFENTELSISTRGYTLSTATSDTELGDAEAKKLIKAAYRHANTIKNGIRYSSADFKDTAHFKKTVGLVTTITQRQNDFFALHAITDTTPSNGLPQIALGRDWKFARSKSGKDYYSSLIDSDSRKYVLILKVENEHDAYAVTGKINLTGKVVFQTQEICPPEEFYLEECLWSTREILKKKCKSMNIY